MSRVPVGKKGQWPLFLTLAFCASCTSKGSGEPDYWVKDTFTVYETVYPRVDVFFLADDSFTEKDHPLDPFGTEVSQAFDDGIIVDDGLEAEEGLEVAEAYEAKDLFDGEATEGCGPDGTPCDDGDPCTINDRCKAQVCKGVPMPCTDDGLSCTEDKCIEGTCSHPIKEGYCAIGNACYLEGSLNPNNTCEWCKPQVSQKSWAPRPDGEPCNDGNPCTEGDRCAGGLCLPGPNKCIPPECSSHSDCSDTEACAPWALDGKMHCSRLCNGPSDCKAGETCTHLPGSASLGFCEATTSQGQGFGASCVDGSQCVSNLCLFGVCGDFCSGEGACPQGTCHFGDFDGPACLPDSSMATLKPFGEACTKDGIAWKPELCRSGHCDLLSTNKSCERLCATDNDCLSGQVCNVIAYSEEATLSGAPLVPSGPKAFHDAVLGCFTLFGGMKQPGEECNADEECKRGKCVALESGPGGKYCTVLCSSTSSCPAGMTCSLVQMPLDNYWLQQNFSQKPRPDAFTLVRLCKRP